MIDLPDYDITEEELDRVISHLSGSRGQLRGDEFIKIGISMSDQPPSIVIEDCMRVTDRDKANCESCGRTFKTRSGLDRHMTTYHKEEPS